MKTGEQSTKIEIKKSKFGRGVFAKEDIKAYETLCISPTIRFPEEEKKLILATKLSQYVFEDNDEIVLVLGTGSLFNHSTNSNAYVCIAKNYTDMIFRSEIDIKKGEEIFIDYGYSLKENDKTYKKNRKEILKILA